MQTNANSHAKRLVHGFGLRIIQAKANSIGRGMTNQMISNEYKYKVV